MAYEAQYDMCLSFLKSWGNMAVLEQLLRPGEKTDPINVKELYAWIESDVPPEEIVECYGGITKEQVRSIKLSYWSA